LVFKIGVAELSHEIPFLRSSSMEAITIQTVQRTLNSNLSHVRSGQDQIIKIMQR